MCGLASSSQAVPAISGGLYRMFHTEAGRTVREGGRVCRVVLDYEMKQQAYAPLASVRDLEPLAYAERQ